MRTCGCGCPMLEEQPYEVLAISLLARGLRLAMPHGAPRHWARMSEPPLDLSMEECLAMQAAKNDGASRADMKKACQWTTDENGPNTVPAPQQPRAIDSTPSGPCKAR